MALLTAAQAFSDGATEIFDLVDESTDVPPETRIKSLGGLIALKSKTFAAHSVSGGDFSKARANLSEASDEARESIRLIDAIEDRWARLIDSIEQEVAGLEHASPRVTKGALVPDVCMPTASGGTWRLSEQRGVPVLLVVLRHFG